MSQVAAQPDARLRDPAFRRAVIAARDAAPLSEFRGAMLLGRLGICGNCGRYTSGSDPAGAGTCSLHGDGLLAFAMPFQCRDFQVSKTPAAPAYLPGPDDLKLIEAQPG
jgi:hypothetical protein